MICFILVSCSYVAYINCCHVLYWINSLKCLIGWILRYTDNNDLLLAWHGILALHSTLFCCLQNSHILCIVAKACCVLISTCQAIYIYVCMQYLFFSTPFTPEPPSEDCCFSIFQFIYYHYLMRNSVFHRIQIGSVSKLNLIKSSCKYQWLAMLITFDLNFTRFFLWKTHHNKPYYPVILHIICENYSYILVSLH